MRLHATSAGEGPATVILHGLFGTATNFATIGKRLAVSRRVVLMDLRNHGRSGHDPAMDYPVMAADVFETMDALGLEAATLVGHSMGGKVVMQAALAEPGRVTRLLVADIAPVSYPPRHRTTATAMLALPLTAGLTRAAADAALAPAEADPVVRQFLLSNLRFGAEPAWRIGLAEIAAALPAIEGWAGEGRYDGPTLVLRGDRSDYVRTEDRERFRQLFPAARFAALRDAGHWLHADAPDAFVATLDGFLPRD